MANLTLRASIPEIAIGAGMQLRLEAVSPTTGAAITGVTATAWAIYGESIEGGATSPPIEVVPELTYTPETTA